MEKPKGRKSQIIYVSESIHPSIGRRKKNEAGKLKYLYKAYVNKMLSFVCDTTFD